MSSIISQIKPAKTFDPRSFPVRFSRLKNMARAPSIYLHELMNEREPTDEMQFGTAVHSLVLGGAPVALYEGRRDDRIKAWRDFQAKHEGAMILKPDDFDRAHACADAVKRCYVATPWLQGEKERHIAWSIGKRACSSKLDVVNARANEPFVVDLKTTRNAEPSWFLREVRRMHYHAQLAWYLDAAAQTFQTFKRARERELNGGLLGSPRAIIVAIETRAPHPVTVVEIRPSALDQGRKLNRLWFERLMVCEESGEWPDYTSDIVPFEIDESETEFTVTIDGEEVTT